tara:strand:- start:423 stop:830 length:408 start_codon:yes stop_codon:yes gene_type:complete
MDLKDVKAKKTNLQPRFDYGDEMQIKHVQRAVEDIIQFLKKKDKEKAHIDNVCEELSVIFQLEDMPTMKVEDTLWGHVTKDERLGQMYQGYKIATVDGVRTKIPHYGFSGDLDDLDAFVNRLFQKWEDGVKKPVK